MMYTRLLTHTRLSSAVVAIAGLSSMYACTSRAPVETPSRLTHARVAGNVLSETGAPISNAKIGIQLGALSGIPACRPTARDSTTTDTSGAFDRVIGSGPQAYEACVELTVTPPAGSSLAPQTARAPNVQFRSVNEVAAESRLTIVLRGQ